MTPDDFPKTPKDFFGYAKKHDAEMIDLKFVDMVDNLGGGVGRLPDEAMRKRMIAFVDALPSAG